jgi:hypothetical protein
MADPSIGTSNYITPIGIEGNGVTAQKDAMAKSDDSDRLGEAG